MGSPDPIERLVLFDGVCNLCNGSVTFIIRHDRTGRFLFSSLQSQAGQQKLNELQIPITGPESIVLVKNGKAYLRSEAILEIAKDLDGAWRLLSLFGMVPRALRDAVYNWIARNRYRFFGRRDECMIPTAALRARFLN